MQPRTSSTAGGRCRASRKAHGRERRTDGITESRCRSPRWTLIEIHLAKRGGANRSSKLLKTLVAELGIERATPHDLRRTCLTWITRLRLRSRRHGPDRQSQDQHGDRRLR